MGVCLGTSLEGAFDLVPPPGAGGWGFGSIKRGLKKAGRGIKKGAKRGYKVAKKVHKVTVKVNMYPLKMAAKAGKYALRAAAKLAAKPIVWAFRKLAGRRAGYLAYKAHGTTKATAAQKREAAGWALNKVNRSGPVGKLATRILKFVGAHKTAGDGELGGWSDAAAGWAGSYQQDVAACGMTGAEIAAAAATIVAAMAGLMKSLNKPGEAPSNPAAAARQAEPEEEAQPVVEAAEEEGEDSAGLFFRRPLTRARLRKIRRGRALRRAIQRRGVPKPPPAPGRRPPPPPAAPPPPRRRPMMPGRFTGIRKG